MLQRSRRQHFKGWENLGIQRCQWGRTTANWVWLQHHLGNPDAVGVQVLRGGRADTSGQQLRREYRYGRAVSTKPAETTGVEAPSPGHHKAQLRQVVTHGRERQT